MTARSSEARKKRRETTTQWKKDNPNRVKTHRKALYQKKRSLLKELKLGPCVDCKRNYPSYVMDFHHKEPKNRKVGINWGWSNERILEEVKKCELLCANCHRIRTWQV